MTWWMWILIMLAPSLAISLGGLFALATGQMKWGKNE